MTSPFPGMDPYLEEPSMWPDRHNSLIATIRDQIQEQIAPHYRAVLTPHIVYENIEIAPVRSRLPDVGLFERQTPGSESGVTVAIEPAPLTLPAVMEVATEYSQIEIRTVRDHVLVTAIELLSPANKRPGAEGADAYEKKRQELFRSTAHLLEIDLLRNGRRPQIARPLPDAPYFIFLSRVQYRPAIEIWPLSLRAPIKPVPVPLRHPDPPVPLDLGAAIHETYRRARFDLDIDYREPPPPPDLSAEDTAWLDAHLQAAGVR